MSQPVSFKDVLLKITDSSRIGHGEFIFKEMGSRTLQQVLMTLSVARLHEIPVLIEQENRYNVFGLWDMLPYAIELIATDKDNMACALPHDNILSSYKASFHRKLRSTIAEHLGNKPSMHDFVSISSSHTLYEVVEAMIEKKYTQVSIVGDNNILLNVVTMPLISHFLYVNRVRMHGWYFSITVAELKLGGTEPLCTILDREPVIYAYKLMHEKQVTCCAVLNNERKVVGCINLNDLQLVFKPKRSVADLFLSALKFIELGLEYSKGVVPAPYATCATCTSDSTLGELLTYSIRNRASNFFLIEPDQTVGRLITSRDIITAFFTAEKPMRSISSPLTTARPSFIGSPNLSYT